MVSFSLPPSSTIAELTKLFREKFDLSLERRVVIIQVGLLNGETEKLDASSEIMTVLKRMSIKKHVLVAKIKDTTKFDRNKVFRKGLDKQKLRDKTVSDTSWMGARNSTDEVKSFQYSSLGRNGKLKLPKFMASTTTISSENGTTEQVIKTTSDETGPLDDSDTSSRLSDGLKKG